jgi:hypothetical protein
MNVERASIGTGTEHIVVASRNPNYVLKRPILTNRLVHALTRTNADTIRRDINHTQLIVAALEDIRVPQTRVFPRGTSYILAQRRIDDDGSANIGSVLATKADVFLQERYHIKPQNFHSSQGIIYIVDPTKSPRTRIFGILGIGEYAFIRMRRHFRKRIRYNYLVVCLGDPQLLMEWQRYTTPILRYGRSTLFRK